MGIGLLLKVFTTHCPWPWQLAGPNKIIYLYNLFSALTVCHVALMVTVCHRWGCLQVVSTTAPAGYDICYFSIAVYGCYEFFVYFFRGLISDIIDVFRRYYDHLIKYLIWKKKQSGNTIHFYSKHHWACSVTQLITLTNFLGDIMII